MPTPSKQDAPVAEDPIARFDPLTAEVLELVTAHRRWIVIQRLSTASDSSDDGVAVTLRDLRSYVAAVEADVYDRDADHAHRKSVTVALHQTHLPLLDAHGLLSYDEDRKVVVPTERCHHVALALNSLLSTLKGLPIEHRDPETEAA